MFQLLGRGISDSSIAERRSILPWALWERWLRDALRSTAHRRRHPEAFYQGWRLEVPVRHPKTRKVLRTIRLREIWAQVHRHGWRSEPVRLWTSILDPKLAPAGELVELYGQRWEQELYFRQLKLQLRRTELLQSHTLTTAAQEIALFVLATALVARERVHAAKGMAPVLRVSFVKVLELLRPLWLFLAIGRGIISEPQQRKLIQRFYDYMLLPRPAKTATELSAQSAPTCG